jgi:hypothetical protein
MFAQLLMLQNMTNVLNFLKVQKIDIAKVRQIYAQFLIKN